MAPAVHDDDDNTLKPPKRRQPRNPPLDRHRKINDDDGDDDDRDEQDLSIGPAGVHYRGAGRGLVDPRTVLPLLYLAGLIILLMVVLAFFREFAKWML